MPSKTYQLEEQIHDYLIDKTLRDQDVLRRLRAETAEMAQGGMQISPEQGQFMQLLIKILGAKRTLEVGTFTGYSALVVALALPDDGQVIACDVSEEYTSIARRYWQEAGVSDKIDLRLGPALATLDAMLANGEENSFDFAFIDADKENYGNYYERCLRLVRPGGVIGVDNALWSGRVADETEQDQSTQAIRTLNEKVRNDERVDMSLVPIGDGLLLACKR